MEIRHLRCWISNGEDKYVGFILNFCKVAVQKDYARTQFNLISFFFFLSLLMFGSKKLDALATLQYLIPFIIISNGIILLH